MSDGAWLRQIAGLLSDRIDLMRTDHEYQASNPQELCISRVPAPSLLCLFTVELKSSKVTLSRGLHTSIPIHDGGLLLPPR
jgi:hypothetical protein